MKIPRRAFLLIFGLLAMAAGAARAEAPSLMTYQGRLMESGSLVNGNRDVIVKICQAASGGPACVSTGVNTVTVTNGLFRTVFTSNIGAPDLSAPGNSYWLEIWVGPVGGPYTALTPREQLTSSAYAIVAATASYISAGQVGTGVLNSGVTVMPGQIGTGTIVNPITISAGSLGSGVTISGGVNVAAGQIGTGTIVNPITITNGTLGSGVTIGPGINIPAGQIGTGTIINPVTISAGSLGSGVTIGPGINIPAGQIGTGTIVNPITITSGVLGTGVAVSATISAGQIGTGSILNPVTVLAPFQFNPSQWFIGGAEFGLSHSSFSNGALYVYDQITSSGSLSTAHLTIAAGVSPTLSGCGSAPAGLLSGNDAVGRITAGGASPISCTVTFATPYNGVPVCFVNYENATTTARVSSVSRTAFTITTAAGMTAGDAMDYHCIGR